MSTNEQARYTKDQVRALADKFRYAGTDEFSEEGADILDAYAATLRQSSAPAGGVSDAMARWMDEPFVNLTPMRRMDMGDFVRRVAALEAALSAPEPAAQGEAVAGLSVVRRHALAQQTEYASADSACTSAPAASPTGVPDAVFQNLAQISEGGRLSQGEMQDMAAEAYNLLAKATNRKYAAPSAPEPAAQGEVGVGVDVTSDGMHVCVRLGDTIVYSQFHPAPPAHPAERVADLSANLTSALKLVAHQRKQIEALEAALAAQGQGERCKPCRGDGNIMEMRCIACDGKGCVPAPAASPAGVPDGQRIYTRADVTEWRDNAFESAAKIVDRYAENFKEITHAADDIRALKSAPSAPEGDGGEG